MRLTQKPVTVLLCSVALLAFTGTAFAKKHRHVRQAASAIETSTGPAMHDDRYPYLDQPHVAVRASKKGRKHVAAAEAVANSMASSDPLISEARRYLGTNPTGRKSLWCGAFLDMVLKHTGHKGGGNLARAYAHYGTRVAGPQVGAIAVLARSGGGHVGIVTGVDAHGNPIIISGNHNHEVAEAVYPRGRIIAYVMPN
ncbi:MAG TPA: TIGR02594 family protein [Pseudolabrys sp.]|jgi:uncharacterized protein (TIGR02594 family)|nr:TIGR02594 family protein [Pseudolabrys sp.]